MTPTSDHIRAISKAPAKGQTLLDYKLDAMLIYLQNGIALLNNGIFAGLAPLVSLTGTLSELLPYKDVSGGGTTS